MGYHTTAWAYTVVADERCELTMAQSATLAAIAHRCNEPKNFSTVSETEAHPGISRISNEANANRSTVCRALKKLKALGYLRVERECRKGEWDRNRYYLQVDRSCDDLHERKALLEGWKMARQEDMPEYPSDEWFKGVVVSRNQVVALCDQGSRLSQLGSRAVQLGWLPLATRVVAQCASNSHVNSPSNSPQNSQSTSSSSGENPGRGSEGEKEVEDENLENPEIVTESYDSIRDAMLDLDKSCGTSIVSYLSHDAETRLTDLVHTDTLEGSLERLRHFVGLIRFKRVEHEKEEAKLRGRVLRETFENPDYLEAVLTCSASDLTDKLSALSRDYKPGPSSNVAAYWSYKLDDLVADDPTANQAASKVTEEVVSEQIEAKDREEGQLASQTDTPVSHMQAAGPTRAYNHRELARKLGVESNVAAARIGLVLLSDDKPAHDPKQTRQLCPLIDALHDIGADIELSDAVQDGLNAAGEAQGLDNAYGALCDMDYADWLTTVGLDPHRIATLDGVAPGTLGYQLNNHMPNDIQDRLREEAS